MKPHVTQLTGMLEKPGLMAWANNLGLQGIELKAKQKESKERGISFHSQVETGNFEREFDKNNFLSFIKDKKIIAKEQSIETEWFVGRYDALVEYQGEQYIIDYKSGFRGKAYLENKLQLIAYTMAVPAKMAIVGIPHFDWHEVVIESREKYERMLVLLAELWALKAAIA
jgi:ATP-dependent exoDNAse (exonuclease V) beta subunit